MAKPLKDDAVAELAQEIRALAGKLTRALRDHGGRLGLTPSQSEVLGYVYREGPMTVTELAKRQGVRSQSMGATVTALEAEGFVVSSPDPNDGRQKVVGPTKQGMKRVTDARIVKEDWLTRGLVGDFTPDEQRTLRDAMVLLNRLIES